MRGQDHVRIEYLDVYPTFTFASIVAIFLSFQPHVDILTEIQAVSLKARAFSSCCVLRCHMSTTIAGWVDINLGTTHIALTGPEPAHAILSAGGK